MIDINNYSLNSPSFNLTQNIKPKGKESIPFIFNDNLNYLRYLYNSGKLRNVTYDHIQKTILCGSIYLGYDLYVCPDCGKESIIPHRCHSKFCTTCGSKETKQRAARISKYEDDKKMIRWWYNRHEDDQYVEVYRKVKYFLNNLILHCPEENFKMVRYYGFYSNKNKDLLEKVYQLYGIKKKRHIRNISERNKELKIKLNHLKFRTHMIKPYLRDPLLCTCGALMKYEYTYDPFEGGTPNDRQYRERCLNESRRMRMDRRRN